MPTAWGAALQQDLCAVPSAGYVLQPPKDGEMQTWLEQDPLPPLPRVNAPNSALWDNAGFSTAES